MVVVKTSILALYYELFGSVRFRRTIWGLGIFIGCWFITFTVLSIVTCRGFSGTGEAATRSAPICTTAIKPAYWTHSLTNIFTDAIILLLPLSVIWRLQLHTHDKVALSVVFLLGSISVIASSARLAYTAVQSGQDTTWAYPVLAMWTEIEVLVALVAASLATMRPLFMVTVLPLLRVVSGGRLFAGSDSRSRTRSTLPARSGVPALPRSGERKADPPHRASRLSRLAGGRRTSEGSSMFCITGEQSAAGSRETAGDEHVEAHALALWPLEPGGESGKTPFTQYTSRSESTESGARGSSPDEEMGKSKKAQDAGEARR